MRLFTRRKKWSVGVDFSGDQLKVVCLKRHHADVPELVAYGIMKKDSKALSGMAKEWDKHSVRINIEDPSLKIKKVELPEMTDSEIRESIKYAFKKAVDFSIDDYLLQYRKLPYQSGEKMSLIVYGIKNEVVSNRVKELNKIGFQNIDVIEPSAAALLVLLNNINPEPQDKPIALIDMGATKSLFSVIKKGNLISSRVITSLSGRNLTDQISRDLGISIEEAEAKKVNVNNGDNDPIKERLLNTISIYISSATLEMQRSIDAYSAFSQNESVSEIYMVGGGSLIPDLQTRLTSALGLPIKFLNPFEKIRIRNSVGKDFDEKKQLFGIACGLALGD